MKLRNEKSCNDLLEQLAIKNVLPDAKGKTIFDIGCGYGHNSRKRRSNIKIHVFILRRAIMNICVLMGSMRKEGNTKPLLHPFIEELKDKKATVQYIWLYDKHIEPCRSCFDCQNIEGKAGCSISDEMNDIYGAILEVDCIVFATPIYSWFCTAPMKVVIDRLFSMNKFYGNTKTKYGLW